MGDASPPPALLATPHRRRLREMWRSAGWPCRDSVEIELLAAGLLEVAQPAPRRAMRLPFAVWMTLARARAEPDDSADAQGWLGAPDAA